MKEGACVQRFSELESCQGSHLNPNFLLLLDSKSLLNAEALSCPVKAPPAAG